MKRLFVIFLVLTMAVSLTACGAGNVASLADDGTISVVTTIFPIYDWTRQVLGEDAEAELTFLLSSGVDLHSYQPTAADLLKLATCDLFIYVGGESDAWAEDALSEAANPNMIALNLMDVLGENLAEEELVEGMEGEAEEADAEEIEYDEHIWLSLKNAETLVQAISDAMAEIDPDNAASYADNALNYVNQLADLDAAYQSAAAAGERDTLLFGDRFPFRYLTDDYGLNYYAAFSGCSAETEASFETVVFLASKVDELHLPAVLTIENSDGRIAQTIVENTKSKDQTILAMDSMQGTTGRDANDGATYLGIMESNLNILKQALQ